MRERIRWVALFALVVIAGVLCWKFIPWKVIYSFIQPFRFHLIVAVGALAALAIIWLILQIVPKRQAEAVKKSRALIKPAELFSIENEARKTLSQIIGGFVVIIGLFISGASLITTQREAEKNRTLALEGQITDRFTKAIGQLGDEKLEVRLGGIYALERIAKDSPKDHWTIMEVLTAYVRENAPRKELLPAEKTSSRKSTRENDTQKARPKTDIQAILTVIGRRKIGEEKNKIDLRNTDLRGADLGNANLSGADLSEADLSGANLSRAILREANLNWVNLSGAYLNWVYLSGATLNTADLSGAYLGEAEMVGVEMFGTNLDRADLRGANLSKAILFGAHLFGAILREANLSGAVLAGDLRGVNLLNTNLRGGNLVGSRSLSWETISFAIIDHTTELPFEIENAHKDELKAMRERANKRE